MDESASVSLLQFSLGGEWHALPIDSVDRIIRAVELRPLPGAPQVIRGLFSLHGRLVPVADPRRRFGLAERKLALDDRIIVARAPVRPLGLLVESEVAVVTCPRRAIVAAESVLSETDLLQGVVHLPDGLVLIHSLAKFLSLDEERRLAEALHAVA